VPYGTGMNPQNGDKIRFVVVSKVAHPWYDEVLRGAQQQATAMSAELRRPIVVEYVAPVEASVEAQHAALDAVVASHPAGIAVDPVESPADIPALKQAAALDIAVVVFDSPAPQADVTGVGNNFAEQGEIAARRLVTLLDGHGEVAIMKGVPDAPNHLQRYRSQLAVLADYPEITIVDGGADHDDINRAEVEAAAVLKAHPNLRGYLACDASGPIGIARALESAGQVGQVQAVGMDSIKPIAQAVADGVLESSVATIPVMQGAMTVLMLWQASLGMPVPRFVDTGIDVVTSANAAKYL
jgi:ribose transport system substrate-binding protein